MNTEDQKLIFAMPSLAISEIQPLEKYGASNSGNDEWWMGEV